MMHNWHWKYRIAAMGLAVALLLLLILALEWWYAQRYREQVLEKILNVQGDPVPMSPLPEYTFPDKEVDDYSALVERPLFFEGRQPIEVDDTEEAPEVSAPPPPPQKDFALKLIGIIAGSEGYYGVFENPQEKIRKNRFVRLKKGDEFEGWRIAEISRETVWIEAGEQKKALGLRQIVAPDNPYTLSVQPSGKPLPPPPAPPAPPPAAAPPSGTESPKLSVPPPPQ